MLFKINLIMNLTGEPNNAGESRTHISECCINSPRSISFS